MAEGLIPNFISTYLAVLTMLLLGLGVEDYYVSRPAVLANTVALLVHVEEYTVIGLVPFVYTVFGLIFGIGGFVAYIFDRPLPESYYEISYFLYSSAPVALFIILSLVFTPSTLWLALAISVGTILNSRLLVSIWENIAPVAEFDRPVRLAVWLFGTRN